MRSIWGSAVVFVLAFLASIFSPPTASADNILVGEGNTISSMLSGWLDPENEGSDLQDAADALESLIAYDLESWETHCPALTDDTPGTFGLIIVFQMIDGDFVTTPYIITEPQYDDIFPNTPWLCEAPDYTYAGLVYDLDTFTQPAYVKPIGLFDFGYDLFGSNGTNVGRWVGEIHGDEPYDCDDVPGSVYMGTDLRGALGWFWQMWFARYGYYLYYPGCSLFIQHAPDDSGDPEEALVAPEDQ